MFESFVLGAMVWIAAHSNLEVRPDTMEVRFSTMDEIGCVLEGFKSCEAAELESEWYGYYQDAHKTPSGRAVGVIAADMPRHHVLAIYSIILHETIHHLQRGEGSYPERECQAYKLESAWLEAHGASMVEVFNMQPIVHKMKMQCGIYP